MSLCGSEARLKRCRGRCQQKSWVQRRPPENRLAETEDLAGSYDREVIHGEAPPARSGDTLRSHTRVTARSCAWRRGGIHTHTYPRAFRVTAPTWTLVTSHLSCGLVVVVLRGCQADPARSCPQAPAAKGALWTGQRRVQAALGHSVDAVGGLFRAGRAPDPRGDAHEPGGLLLRPSPQRRSGASSDGVGCQAESPMEISDRSSMHRRIQHPPVPWERPKSCMGGRRRSDVATRI